MSSDQAHPVGPGDELSSPGEAKTALPLLPIGLAFAAGIAVVAVVAVVFSGGGDDAGSDALAPATTRPAGTFARTEVPAPAAEPTEALRPEPTPSLDPIARELLDEIVASLEGNAIELGLSDPPETVTLVRFEDGALELELRTRWASQDRQADVSFKVISSLATKLGSYSEQDLIGFAGGSSFEIAITTYSVGEDYRYQSLTDYATLSALAKSQINDQEWVEAASAGFR